MAQDFYGYDEEEEAPKKGGNLFLWTIFILLLVGLAFACWLGSFYVFGHPEQARPYRILMKLKKIEPPKRFEVTAAPGGDFLGSQRMFERYANLTRLEFDRENANLLRDYIRNYRETKKLVPYITGRFNILDTYELSPKDMFASGVVTLAQSVDYPKVLIEHIYTAPQENVPLLKKMLQTGLDMNIKRTDDCAAVIFIDRMYDGRLKFTVLSLLYGTYALKQGSGMFSLEPPLSLNMEAGLPVVKPAALQDAIRAYAEYRRKNPDATVQPGETPVPGQELVRVDTVEPGTPVPESGAVTPVAVATPPPVIATPGAKGTPKPTPGQVAMLATPRVIPGVPVATPLPVRATPIPPRATPLPVATPAMTAIATPPPATPAMSPSGVPLKPFNPGAEIVAQPDPSKQIPSSGNWKVYAPGQVPSARLLTTEEAGSLAGKGMIGETLYLRGSFRVTANGVGRAVLREAGKTDEQSARILVEYPAGFVSPNEGEIFTRDNARPYQIYSVRRGTDGTLTIYVREIVQQ